MKLLRRNSIIVIVMFFISLVWMLFASTQIKEDNYIKSDIDNIALNLNLCEEHDLCIDINTSTEASCANEGNVTYVCSRCDYVKLIILPQTGHVLKTIQDQKQTCTTDGVVVQQCKYCDYNTISRTQKLGHDFSKSSPKINNQGSSCLKSTCKRCGYQKTSILENNFIRKYGYIAKLESQDMGIDVLICDERNGRKNSQYLVDKAYCAAYFVLRGKAVIADHNYQGFENIKSAIVNKTTLTFDNKTYVCVAKFNGHNTGKDIVDNSYKPINDSYPGDILLYTCNNNWRNITITLWDVVN